MLKRVECSVTGRVQMVMFRDFVTRKARLLGLTGFVENKRNGSVHVVAEGEEERLQELVSLLHKGSVLSKVNEVQVDWQEPTSEFDGFTLIRTVS